MTRWRFGDSEADGEAWLRDPLTTFVYVDYEAQDNAGQSSWRRMVVVTKSWLDGQIAAVGDPTSGLAWVSTPAMLILPDSTGEELRRHVERAVHEGALDLHSVSLGDE